MISTTEVHPLLVNGKRAAAMLGISERTLARLVRDGKIRRVKVLNSLRFDVNDLKTWIESAKSPQKEAVS